ncbi:MAG: ankyrin repeat domain-containing protein, partial [Sphingobacteriia bacterium]|nr:ankyrin repeat domain-containing protein [Sphingobacteriia bacterium]
NPDEQLIKTMLNKGANPNAQKSTGRTPLHFACKKVGTDKSRPHADIASLFVDYGGDPTIKDNNGITPQEEINKGKPQQIVQQPVQQHYAPQPQPVNQVSAYAPQLNSPAININSISNNNHTDVVNVKDHLGRTPIFYAVMSQNIDAVKELLNKGAKIDLEDATGLKPANYARALNNEEIINALAEHSIKQATQNMGQSTAKPLPPTPPAKARTSTTPPKPAHMEAHRNKEVPTSSLGNLAPKPCPTFRSTNEVGKKSGNEHGH